MSLPSADALVLAILDPDRRAAFITAVHQGNAVRCPPVRLGGYRRHEWRAIAAADRGIILDELAPLGTDAAALIARLRFGVIPSPLTTTTTAPAPAPAPAPVPPRASATQVVPCAAQCGDYVPARGHAPRLLWCADCTDATTRRRRRRG